MIHVTDGAMRYINKKGKNILIRFDYQSNTGNCWVGDALGGRYIPVLQLVDRSLKPDCPHEDFGGITVWYPPTLRPVAGKDVVTICVKSLFWIKRLELEDALVLNSKPGGRNPSIHDMGE